MILDPAAGELERELYVEGGSVVAYSPDGRLLAIGGEMAVCLVDCKTWQVKATLKGHMRSVYGLAFSSDGKRLASASQEQVILWNLVTQTPTLTLAPPKPFSSVAFSPDGRLLALAAGGWMRIYRSASEQEVVAGRPQPEAIPEMELGDTCRRRKAWDEAIVHYTRAIEQTPDDDAGWLGRARCYVENDEIDLALQDYQQADHIWRKFGLAFRPSTVVSGNLLLLARQCQTQGRMEQALAVRRLVLRMHEATYEKALQFKPGLDFLSVTTLSPYVTSSISLAENNRKLGVALMQVGDPSAAEPYFRKSLEILADIEWEERPSRVGKEQYETQARKGLIGCLTAQGRFQKAIELDPDNALPYRSLGDALRLDHKPDAAIDAYRKAIELRTDGGGPHNNLGLALRANGQEPDAIAAFEKAVQFFSSLLEENSSNELARSNLGIAFNNLAVSLLRQGQYADAVVNFKKCIEMGKNDYQLWHQLAQCHLTLGNTEEYEQSCKAIVAQFPAPDERKALDWSILGQAFYGAGQFEEARQSLEQGIELRGDKGPSLKGGARWWFYSMTLSRLGETDRARAIFEQLVQVVKQNPPAIKRAMHDRLRAEAAELLGIDVELQEKEEP